MGAVEDTRKVLQDFLAPELRTVAAKLEALVEEQARLRTEFAASEARMQHEANSTESRLRNEIVGVEARTRAEILASEGRVLAAIERLRGDLPLLIRNAVLEQTLAEKQRIIEELQKQTH